MWKWIVDNFSTIVWVGYSVATVIGHALPAGPLKDFCLGLGLDVQKSLTGATAMMNPPADPPAKP
jgi:hypothetical protein